MGSEITLVVWGAIAGLASAVALEFVKHRFERKQTAFLESQEQEKKQAEAVAGFLRGDSAANTAGAAPGPAWLRQVTAARRYPLARLGLRSDEDYNTAAHAAAQEKPSPANVTTLLKTFRRGNTFIKRPSRQKGGKFLLGPSHILGRGSKCDIQVLDPAVSLLHAFIRFEVDQYVLYDLGSTSGTFVNEEPVNVTGVPLLGGEIIRMGDTIFEFGRVAKGADADPADPFLII